VRELLYAYRMSRHVTAALHLLRGGNVSPALSGIVFCRPAFSHRTHANTPETGFLCPVWKVAPIGVWV
jgi:hypothetical protein